MSPLRKKSLAWALVATAVAFAALAVSFAYLRERHVTDEALIESKVTDFAKDQRFKLDEARKAGYSDAEIAAHLAKAGRAEFDHQWKRILLAVSSSYIVVVLVISATVLLRESNEIKNSS